MKIIITRNANRALYRDLQKSIDGQWTHRTVNAAAQRLIWLARSDDRMRESVGNFGGISIQIDGMDISEFEVRRLEELAHECARGDESDSYLVTALTKAAEATKGEGA
jgi:hypothetical protein